MLYSRLVPSGVVDIATDDAVYFRDIEDTVRNSATAWKSVVLSMEQRITHPEVSTNYEVKYRSEGRSIYYLCLRK